MKVGSLAIPIQDICNPLAKILYKSQKSLVTNSSMNYDVNMHIDSSALQDYSTRSNLPTKYVTFHM